MKDWEFSSMPRAYLDLVSILHPFSVNYFRSHAFVAKVAALAREIESLLHFEWKDEEGIVDLK